MQTSKTGITKEYCFLFSGAVYHATLQRGTVTSEMLFTYTNHTETRPAQVLGSVTQILRYPCSEYDGICNTQNLTITYRYIFYK